MTSYFPDINVWLSLSVRQHVHNDTATRWLNTVRIEDRLVFSRYTQLGFLRLLTNPSAMEKALNTVDAWAAFDKWLQDPRVEVYPEPRSVDTAFRHATAPFFNEPASKWIGDCYLLAFARQTDTVLVTFDRALQNLALTNSYKVVAPH